MRVEMGKSGLAANVMQFMCLKGLRFVSFTSLELWPRV